MSLYMLSEEYRKFVAKCAAEDDRDVRHLGRHLTFSYTCPNCGPSLVSLTPDYPYCGANNDWTCSRCAAVMRLNSPVPVEGIPKACTFTAIRKELI